MKPVWWSLYWPIRWLNNGLWRATEGVESIRYRWEHVRWWNRVDPLYYLQSALWWARRPVHRAVFRLWLATYPSAEEVQ